MLKRLLPLVLLLAGLITGAQASITVQSPVSGSNVPNPVHVTASNPDANHMKIYVDDVQVYAVDSDRIDTDLTLQAGTRDIVVQSWTNTGYVEKYPVTITVVNQQFAHVVRDIEDKLPWMSCGSCGNSAGNANYVWGKQTAVSTPSLDGTATKFEVGGPNRYTNYYWYIKVYDNRTIKLTRQEYDIWIPKQFGNTPQAIEFETQHKYNNYTYNMAMQMGYSNGYWRTFHRKYSNSEWVSTGVRFVPLPTEQWVHIAADFTVDYLKHTTTLVAWYVNGTKYVPLQNATYTALYEPGKNYTSYASFQLDMNKYATDYYVFLDNYTYSY